MGKGVKWEDKSNDTNSGKHQYLLSKCKDRNAQKKKKRIAGDILN